ncbi:MAG: guanylate kinase [Butyrivibrio sp.]|nr:guanylate kinase [Butyrivibrio sp.]
MGKIFVILGKSSSGKDHIFKDLMEDSELALNKVVIYTTRPMRQGEQEGVQYFFRDLEGYKELLNSRKIIEERSYDTIYGEWKYFTVDDGQINLDNGDYLIIGTIDSLISIKNYYGEDNVIPILVETDDGIRLQRALKRELKQKEPKYAEMCRRFLADEADFSSDRKKQAGIDRIFENNSKLEDCITDIKKFIQTYK